MHYYDEDKYAVCPHCAAAEKKAAVKPEVKAAPGFGPVVAEAPKPDTFSVSGPSQGEAPGNYQSEAKPGSEAKTGSESKPGYDEKPGLEAKLEPEAKPEQKAQSEILPEGMWKCSCGALNDSNFCYLCGSRRPAQSEGTETKAASEAGKEQVAEAEKGWSPEAGKVQIPETEKSLTPEADTEPRSLTEALNEVSFTGSLGDAKEKAAGGNDDEGVTRIIFDELADNLVLGWLVAVNTEIRGRVFTISETKVTIGRSDLEHPTDIDLHGDRAVSRGAQAVIVYDPLNKKFFINSAGGKTSVYVNRQMVMVPVELSAGDIIMLGETELVFTPLCTEKFSW